jgi:hypothetical protein
MHWRLEIAGVLTTVRQLPDFQRPGPLLSAWGDVNTSHVGPGHLHLATGHTGTATTLKTGMSTFSLNLFPGDGRSSTNTP